MPYHLIFSILNINQWPCCPVSCAKRLVDMSLDFHSIIFPNAALAALRPWPFPFLLIEVALPPAPRRILFKDLDNFSFILTSSLVRYPSQAYLWLQLNHLSLEAQVLRIYNLWLANQRIP